MRLRSLKIPLQRSVMLAMMITRRSVQALYDLGKYPLLNAGPPQHKFHCQCTEYLQAQGVTQAQTIPIFGDTDEVDIEEEFSKKPDVDVDELCKEYERLALDDPNPGDPFYEAAKMLYRAQGRRWIGSYECLDILCAACFLEKEEYIGKKCPAGSAGFTPVPKTYISACQPDTLDSVYIT